MKGTYVTRTCQEIHYRHSCAPVQKKQRHKGVSEGEHSTIFIKGGFV